MAAHTHTSAPAVRSPKSALPPGLAASSGRETADLTLRRLEHLAAQPGQCGVTELSRQFNTSKATTHRHLRTLTQREFARWVDEGGLKKAINDFLVLQPDTPPILKPLVQADVRR